MVRFETYTCMNCGKKFTAAVGGIVMTPQDLELMTRPICDKCKLKSIIDIFK